MRRVQGCAEAEHILVHYVHILVGLSHRRRNRGGSSPPNLKLEGQSPPTFVQIVNTCSNQWCQAVKSQLIDFEAQNSEIKSLWIINFSFLANQAPPVMEISTVPAGELLQNGERWSCVVSMACYSKLSQCTMCTLSQGVKNIAIPWAKISLGIQSHIEKRSEKHIPWGKCY